MARRESTEPEHILYVRIQAFEPTPPACACPHADRPWSKRRGSWV